MAASGQLSELHKVLLMLHTTGRTRETVSRFLPYGGKRPIITWLGTLFATILLFSGLILYIYKVIINYLQVVLSSVKKLSKEELKAIKDIRKACAVHAVKAVQKVCPQHIKSWFYFNLRLITLGWGYAHKVHQQFIL